MCTEGDADRPNKIFYCISTNAFEGLRLFQYSLSVAIRAAAFLLSWSGHRRNASQGLTLRNSKALFVFPGALQWKGRQPDGCLCCRLGPTLEVHALAATRGDSGMLIEVQSRKMRFLYTKKTS